MMRSLMPLLGQAVDPNQPVTIPPWGRRAQEVFEGWQNTGDMFPVRSLLIMLGGVLLIFICLAIRQWYRDRPKEPGSSVLFRRIARQVGLGWLDQWLLLQIARANRLPSPLTLLVARGTFLHYAHQYAEAVSGWRKPMVAARASRILGRVYGSAGHAQQEIQAIIEEEFCQPPAKHVPPATAASSAKADDPRGAVIPSGDHAPGN